MGSYVVLELIATWVGAHQRLPGRFLGITMPGPLAAQTAYYGTAISAPLFALVLTLFAVIRAQRCIPWLAIVFVIGGLGELATYRAFTPSADALRTPIVAASLLLPTVALVSSLFAVRRERGR